MDLATIKDLYDFNRWANARVLTAASQLSSEQFLRDLGSSFRSIRDTLTHILAAEWIWLERWNGRSPRSMPGGWEFQTVKALTAEWERVEHHQKEFINRLTEEQLQAIVQYVNIKGETWAYPLWQQLVHVVNHSTYHRGQITTMLRQVAAEPVATDFLVFFDQKPRD